MNRRKIITTISVLTLILLTVGLTISLAKIDSNNTYVIESDKTNVKANDIVTVTLKVKIPIGSRGIQGRVEYDENLTFLEDELKDEDFGVYGKLNLMTDPDINAIGFAKSLNSEQEKISGNVTVVKLKFKVTGLTGGEYKIYWKDYDENGYFEIDSVTLKRIDTVDIVVDVDKEHNKNETSIDGIIDKEVNKVNQEVNNDENVQNKSEKEPNKDNIKKEVLDKTGSDKKLPKTGEKTLQLIFIVCGILLAVCIYIRIKFLGKEIR